MLHLDLHDVVNRASQGNVRLTAKHQPLMHFIEDSLDISFHIAILFTALVLLLQFIIGPMYTAALTTQVTVAVGDALASAKLDAHSRQLLQISNPVLSVVRRMAEKPSAEVTINNNWLFTYGHVLSIALFVLFGSMLWVLRRVFGGAYMARPTRKVLLENLLLIFPAILVAEYAFFVIIASKYVPMTPSELMHMLADIMNHHHVQGVVQNVRLSGSTS
jgi:hypothetical protein